jgi:hypothetical protein
MNKTQIDERKAFTKELIDKGYTFSETMEAYNAKFGTHYSC